VVSISSLARTDELRLKNVTIKTFLSHPGVHHTISRPKSDRGRSCSTQQQLRLFRMHTVDVDCNPCASKQARIVKFACREQGLGRAVDRSKRSSW